MVGIVLGRSGGGGLQLMMMMIRDGDAFDLGRNIHHSEVVIMRLELKGKGGGGMVVVGVSWFWELQGCCR